ncbi:hypothetical protein BD626DRAFT_727 [Schizophyllum amplum]|uniref:Uncharacterized protein n=1 Tax=Schizophyllum amplum TaxID=97359 RepID=A0A550CVK0_9AGAR|nr:hypothetical protein BD626DRAFT_727 [Auriculariopsis ampla]
MGKDLNIVAGSRGGRLIRGRITDSLNTLVDDRVNLIYHVPSFPSFQPSCPLPPRHARRLSHSRAAAADNDQDHPRMISSGRRARACRRQLRVASSPFVRSRCRLAEHCRRRYAPGCQVPARQQGWPPRGRRRRPRRATALRAVRCHGNISFSDGIDNVAAAMRHSRFWRCVQERRTRGRMARPKAAHIATVCSAVACCSLVPSRLGELFYPSFDLLFC